VLVNDVNRKDVKKYLDTLIKADPRLKGLYADLGIEALAYESGFKIDLAINKITNTISEYYNPQSEVVLLSKLLYEIGYIRFQKPLILNVEVQSSSNIFLEKYQRFTDGISIYLLDEAVTLEANTPQRLTATMATKREIYSNVSTRKHLYHKIDLGTTYRKICSFEVYRGDELLEYSQAFIKESSDVSVEVMHNGNIQLVIRIGNIHGLNIMQEDSLRVVLFESEPSDTIPTNLAMIGNFSSTCTNISKASNYEPYLSLEEMSNIIKYNKNINNSLVYDEDYKSLILKEIKGISLIKVWQQESEDLQNGVEACNINKIFCAYIPDDLLVNVDSQIVSLVANRVYGKVITIRSPIIRDINISIDILNNTKKSISLLALETLKNRLKGLYDDRDRQLNKSIIYKQIVQSLSSNDIDIDLTLTGKGEYLNEVFYDVKKENISINVTERGYV